MSLAEGRMAFTTPAAMSELVKQELERDRQYHPNLGGLTKGGIANHYPMTILALHGLGASDVEVESFRRSWPRHRAAIAADLHLIDRQMVTAENWPEFLGQSERLPEFRRVFESLLVGDQRLDTVTMALTTMQNGLPMGLFHPLIRLSFALLHGERGLIADALAYMAIRYVDLYRRPDLPRSGHATVVRSAASVWRHLAQTTEAASLIQRLDGGSIRRCEQLCGESALHQAALPPGFDLSGATLMLRIPEICTLALRLYLFAPALTTLHAVTAAQALADLTRRAAGMGVASMDQYAVLWARYWIWLTALYLEKGHPTDLPVLDSGFAALDQDWPELAAQARAIPEVHLIKMAYSCQWLDQTFGPEPLFKLAVVNMLNEHAAHPRHGVGMVPAAI